MDILNKKWFKILLKITIVVVLLVVVWLVWKKIVTKDSSIPDNIRFSKDYTQVSEDNIYKYASKKEVLSAFDSEKAVVFFGFPECKWCQAYVKLLNDIAKEYGVNEILYYNIKYDRSKNAKFYKQVQELTKDYLQEDEEGIPRMYVPDVYFIKDGKIIGHNNDTSMISKMELEEYYTKENTEALQNKLSNLFKEISSCDDEKGC